MSRLPVFHKETGKLRQEDLMKNIWCPFYDECMYEAAKKGSLMDCSQCNFSTIDFREDWGNRYIDVWMQ
jgi:hypothetical protein